MDQQIGDVVIPERAIRNRVAEMGDEILNAFGEPAEGITIVSVLAGSIVFLSDLIRQLPTKMRLGIVSVTSYPGRATSSKGAILETWKLPDLRNCHVLIVDDIVESGGTLRLVLDEIKKSAPRSVKTAVLLRKIAKAPKDLPIDFVGFDIDDAFVVGYGLDFDGYYRNLPYIATISATHGA